METKNQTDQKKETPPPTDTQQKLQEVVDHLATLVQTNKELLEKISRLIKRLGTTNRVLKQIEKNIEFDSSPGRMGR